MSQPGTNNDAAQHMRRVEEIFHACLELHSTLAPDATRALPGSRDLIWQKLDELSGDDAALRSEVASLLRLHIQMDDGPIAQRVDPPNARSKITAAGFLDPEVMRGQLADELGLGVHGLLRAGIGVRGANAAITGTRIGGYTILGLLGAGGMGVVYVAEQDRPRRQVALKLIREGLATPSMVSRFEREAEMLGRLSHPGIAQIYEAGVERFESNQPLPDDAVDEPPLLTPYIAMELVRGPTILEYVREQALPVRETVSMLADACDAVQHAHLRGVIHRDLKPQNILVDLSRPTPQPKVLDFGIARAMFVDAAHDAPTAQHSVTIDGQLLGTLSYMSVEQVRGQASDVDTRSDVYALGAILYHLLAGAPPFDPSHRTMPEMLRAICEEAPPSLGSISPSLSGDIDTIVRKAMSNDRGRRYQSAAELADDLRRFLRREPIAARQDSRLYVLRKNIQRYRALVATALLVVVGAMAFAIFAVVKERQQARVAQVAVAARHDAEFQRGRADETAARLAAQLSESRIEQGRLFGESGAFRIAEELIWREHVRHPTSLRSRWALWELYSHFLCRMTIPAHEGNARSIAWRSDGQVLASAGVDRLIKCWDAASGTLRLSIRTDLKQVDQLLFTKDGRTIISSGDGRVMLWDAQAGTLIREIELNGIACECIDLSANDALLLTGGRGGTLSVWDLKANALIWSYERHDASDQRIGISSVRFDGAGGRLAAGYFDGTVHLWATPVSSSTTDAALPELATFAGHRAQVLSISFSPGGHTMATAGQDRIVNIWDIDARAVIQTLEPRNGTLRDIAYSPDGSLLSVVGWWRVDVWETKTWTRYRPNNADRNSGYEAFQARFSPDGRELATCGVPGAVRVTLMDASTGVETLPAHSKPVSSIASARDGSAVILASAAPDGLINVWSRSTNSPVWAQRPPIRTGRPLREIALADDGKTLAVGGADGSIELFDARDGRSIATLSGHQGLVGALAFTHDGTRLVSGGADAILRVWKRAGDQGEDRDRWALEFQRADEPGEILGIAISAGDRMIASSHRPQQVRFWSLPDGAPRLRRMTSNTVWSPTFAHAGGRVGIGAWDRVVEIWDASDVLSAPASNANAAPTVASFLGHTQLISGTSFSADDQLLASASQDGTVKLWDTRTGSSAATAPQAALATLNAHANEAFQVSFLPAPLDHDLAVGYQDGSIRVWDLSQFDRFIAGQLDFQLTRHRAALVGEIDEAAVRHAVMRLAPLPTR